jgi:hypothetical protein
MIPCVEADLPAVGIQSVWMFVAGGVEIGCDCRRE